MREAEDLVSPEDLEDRIIVILGEWQMGIVGLLAGRLCESHYRPVVVCTVDTGNGIYVGSARSIPGYDISQGISACAEHLATFGGHPAAAGFSLVADSFEAFRLALIEHANAHISIEDMQPSLDVDLMLKPADLTLRTVEQLAELEPFGNGHQMPLFGLDDCRVVSVRRIGKDGVHFKAELEAGGRRCAALWWNQGAQASQIRPGQRLSAVFALEEDTYAGNGAVQMVVKDMYSRETP
jgi:single-stranded-DNA-specific exonuclease